MKKLLFLLGLTFGVITLTFVLEVVAEMLDRKYINA